MIFALCTPWCAASRMPTTSRSDCIPGFSATMASATAPTLPSFVASLFFWSCTCLSRCFLYLAARAPMIALTWDPFSSFRLSMVDLSSRCRSRMNPPPLLLHRCVMRYLPLGSALARGGFDRHSPGPLLCDERDAAFRMYVVESHISASATPCASCPCASW